MKKSKLREVADRRGRYKQAIGHEKNEMTDRSGSERQAIGQNEKQVVRGDR